MKPFDEIREILPKLHGWCSQEKARAMAELIIEHKPTTVVEIGVWGGSSLIPQVLACEHVGAGRVYGIDPWDPQESTRGMHDPIHIDWWSTVDHEARLRECMQVLLELNLTKFCTLYRTTSDRAHWLFDEIDVLHVDGNHTEHSATGDAFVYLNKVRSGGFIWFDDIDWVEGSVRTTQRALDLINERCEHVRTLNVKDHAACALFRKR